MSEFVEALEHCAGAARESATGLAEIRDSLKLAAAAYSTAREDCLDVKYAFASKPEVRTPTAARVLGSGPDVARRAETIAATVIAVRGRNTTSRAGLDAASAAREEQARSHLEAAAASAKTAETIKAKLGEETAKRIAAEAATADALRLVGECEEAERAATQKAEDTQNTIADDRPAAGESPAHGGRSVPSEGAKSESSHSRSRTYSRRGSPTGEAKASLSKRAQSRGKRSRRERAESAEAGDDDEGAASVARLQKRRRRGGVGRLKQSGGPGRGADAAGGCGGAARTTGADLPRAPLRTTGADLPVDAVPRSRADDAEPRYWSEQRGRSGGVHPAGYKVLIQNVPAALTMDQIQAWIKHKRCRDPLNIASGGRPKNGCKQLVLTFKQRSGAINAKMLLDGNDLETDRPRTNAVWWKSTAGA